MSAKHPDQTFPNLTRTNVTHTRRLVKTLSLRQLQLLDVLANPDDARTLAEKARSVGISRRTLFNWRHLPGWGAGEILLWQAYRQDRVAAAKQATQRRLARLLAFGADPADVQEAFGNAVPRQKSF